MGLFNGKKRLVQDSSKSVRVESVILKELWSVARDNFNDYVDHFSRADVHQLNSTTAVKPDAKSDEAYA